MSFGQVSLQLRDPASKVLQALGTLRHLPETRRRSELAIDIRMELRNALLPLGEWVRMLDYLQEADALARSLGDQHRLGRIAALMIMPWRVRGWSDVAGSWTTSRWPPRASGRTSLPTRQICLPRCAQKTLGITAAPAGSSARKSQ
jgi:hypothetical protein